MESIKTTGTKDSSRIFNLNSLSNGISSDVQCSYDEVMNDYSICNDTIDLDNDDLIDETTEASDVGNGEINDGFICEDVTDINDDDKTDECISNDEITHETTYNNDVTSIYDDETRIETTCNNDAINSADDETINDTTYNNDVTDIRDDETGYETIHNNDVTYIHDDETTDTADYYNDVASTVNGKLNGTSKPNLNISQHQPMSEVPGKHNGTVISTMSSPDVIFTSSSDVILTQMTVYSLTETSQVTSDTKTSQLTSSTDAEASQVTSSTDAEASQLPYRDGKPGLVQRVFSWRSVIFLLLHLSFIINTLPRLTLPIAIVCMVGPTRQDNVTSGDFNVTGGNFRNTSQTQRFYEFDWDSDTVGLSLSAITFTAWLAPVFTDFLSAYLGNKVTMTCISLASALTTVISPLAARSSPYFLIAIRALSGLVMGGNSPIVSDTIAWWTPEPERLTVTTLTYSGVNVAGIVTFFIAGFLCSIPLDNGWPFVFYIFGAATAIYTIFWHFLIAQKPELHSFVSKRETDYIISQRLAKARTGTVKSVKRERPPYKKVFTSVPVLAFIIVASIHYMNIIVFFTYIPVYFSKVLGFDAETTGVLVSVMSTCRLIGALIWTAVINKLMSRDGMTRNKCRKCVAGAGVLLGTSALVCVAVFQTTNRWLTVVLLIVTMVGQCFAAVIIPALPLDMAPRYSGFITGVATSIAGLASIPGPLIVAQLTPTNSPEEWRTVWLTMSALFASGCIIFILLAQATLQPWANDEPKQKSSPHIFAPLASMGRRLSAFIGAPPRVLAMIGQDVGPAQGVDRQDARVSSNQKGVNL